MAFKIAALSESIKPGRIICRKYAHQSGERQRVYLTLLSVMAWVKEMAMCDCPFRPRND